MTRRPNVQAKPRQVTSACPIRWASVPLLSCVTRVTARWLTGFYTPLGHPSLRAGLLEPLVDLRAPKRAVFINQVKRYVPLFVLRGRVGPGVE